MQCWNRYAVNICNSAPLCRILWTRNSCSKLFVGGLSYDTNETILKIAFQQHREIIESLHMVMTKKLCRNFEAVTIICDRVCGKSKGYGLVQFDSESATSRALKQTNGQLLHGRSIRVSYARK